MWHLNLTRDRLIKAILHFTRTWIRDVWGVPKLKDLVEVQSCRQKNSTSSQCIRAVTFLQQAHRHWHICYRPGDGAASAIGVLPEPVAEATKMANRLCEIRQGGGRIMEGWKWFHVSVDSAIFASAWVTNSKWKVCHRTWIIIRLLGRKCALYWLRSTPVTCSIFCSIFEALPLTSRRKENTGLLSATPFRSFTHYIVRRSTLLTHTQKMKSCLIHASFNTTGLIHAAWT